MRLAFDDIGVIAPADVAGEASLLVVGAVVATAVGVDRPSLPSVYGETRVGSSRGERVGVCTSVIACSDLGEPECAEPGESSSPDDSESLEPGALGGGDVALWWSPLFGSCVLSSQLVKSSMSIGSVPIVRGVDVACNCESPSPSFSDSSPPVTKDVPEARA